MNDRDRIASNSSHVKLKILHSHADMAQENLWKERNMDHTDASRTKLHISKDPMYLMLREGCIKEFNVKKASGDKCDLRGCDLRGLDLRGLDADGLDFRDCYFRQSDLRGLDFSKAKLDGASINACKISGVLFPPELSASEIELSLLHGTRMRYSVK